MSQKEGNVNFKRNCWIMGWKELLFVLTCETYTFKHICSVTASMFWGGLTMWRPFTRGHWTLVMLSESQDNAWKKFFDWQVTIMLLLRGIRVEFREHKYHFARIWQEKGVISAFFLQSRPTRMILMIVYLWTAVSLTWSLWFKKE